MENGKPTNHNNTQNKRYSDSFTTQQRSWNNIMENLEWYPLSVILSYLEELDGTCFMLTRRKYARQLLPAFRIKPPTPSADPLNGLTVVVNNNNTIGNQNHHRQPPKNRHKFIRMPVQDPSTLLARLNTKRLFQRIRKGNGKLLSSDISSGTCQEIALQEWERMRNDTAMSGTPSTVPVEEWYPPSLELLRFLDDDNNNTQKSSDELLMMNMPTTILVSYPRSGNTLVRTLLERITGYVTGSDTRPDRNLSRELAERHDLVGEGVTHSTKVRIVKTHWPERHGNTKYTAKRAILVVRNPYDAIDSYWNMNATCSHTKTLTEEVYDRFRDKFENMVRNEIDIWMKFQEYWIRTASLPVLIVRYEDLVQNAGEEMKRVLQFILGTPTLSQFWIERIRHVTKPSLDKLGSYKPRSGNSVSIGKALYKGHIPTELVQYIHEMCASGGYSSNYLADFGYDILSNQFPDNFAATTWPSLPAHLLPCANRTGFVRVNGTPSIRPVDCEFGRLLQKWRHSVTNHDAEPLPAVGP